MIAGQQITATLRLSRRLGHGNMGSVWTADHLSLGTQVAVKFMSTALATDEHFIERFRREAMAAAQIKSPHIAQVFDHGLTHEGVPYIVMELLEGQDLGKRVNRGGPLPAAEVVSIVSQVARALTRAHQVGIVHRDIKADNIFLMDIDGEVFVKVLDFGIAKNTTDMSLGITTSGSMVGTPLYMSPEQLLSSKYVDARSDFWSLAVVTYFALTGEFPFTGETLGALAVAVNACVFTPPSKRCPDLPPALDAWFQRALQRAPELRFASAREMAEALAQAADVSRGSLDDAQTSSHRAPASVPSMAPPASTPRAPSSVGSRALQGRTFGGTVNSTGATVRRTPVRIIAAVAFALTCGTGAVIFSRSQPSAPAPKSVSAAFPSPISTPAPKSIAEPIVVPASTIPSGAIVRPPASAAPTPPPSAASASLAAGARPATRNRPANVAPSRPPRSTQPATAPPPKDTIGF